MPSAGLSIFVACVRIFTFSFSFRILVVSGRVNSRRDGSRRQRAGKDLSIVQQDESLGYASRGLVKEALRLLCRFAQPLCARGAGNENCFNAIGAKNIPKSNMYKSLGCKCHKEISFPSSNSRHAHSRTAHGGSSGDRTRTLSPAAVLETAAYAISAMLPNEEPSFALHLYRGHGFHQNLQENGEARKNFLANASGRPVLRRPQTQGLNMLIRHPGFLLQRWHVLRQVHFV